MKKIEVQPNFISNLAHALEVAAQAERDGKTLAQILDADQEDEAQEEDSR